jgi:hypothetical protein
MRNLPEQFVAFLCGRTALYGLPHNANASLKIFNTLGQQIAVLQNGEQEAGYHEVKFDGKNLSSGVYF